MPCPMRHEGDQEPDRRPGPRSPFDWVRDWYLRDVNISRRVGWSGPAHDAFVKPFEMVDTLLTELYPSEKFDGVDAGGRMAAIMQELPKRMGASPQELDHSLTAIRDERTSAFDVVPTEPQEVVEEALTEVIKPQYGTLLPGLVDVGGAEAIRSGVPEVGNYPRYPSGRLIDFSQRFGTDPAIWQKKETPTFRDIVGSMQSKIGPQAPKAFTQGDPEL